LGPMAVRMFSSRGHAWEDDGEDVLEQGECLGGRWGGCSGAGEMLGRMMGKCVGRQDVWEDDGEDVLEQGECLGG
jgi:hypothetical protein